MPKKKGYKKKKAYKKKKPIFAQTGYASLLVGASEKKRKALGEQFSESAKKGEIIRIM